MIPQQRHDERPAQQQPEHDRRRLADDAPRRGEGAARDEFAPHRRETGAQTRRGGDAMGARLDRNPGRPESVVLFDPPGAHPRSKTRLTVARRRPGHSSSSRAAASSMS